MDNVFDEQAVLQQAAQGAGIVKYRSDLRVMFYLHATRDELASTREGRPIYVDTIYISTKATGTKDFMSSPVTPEDIRNHPQEWAAFQSSQDSKTPISRLPKITPAEFLTLQELEISSIEDFAASTPTPELERAHAVAVLWVGAIEQKAEEPKRKGWPKGKPRKPREESQAAA